ncbi:glutamine synthetase family protein [Steroidobacter flavus]|uniref:Glutamine synthetase family protein n=1 Tax=Steroidobacter flavus TaxID=1842136 RepID=A0ABV8SP66_9GAMM
MNEAKAFLDAHPDVEAIELLITDPGGVPRGKLIAREELLSLYNDGRCVAGSILGLDVTGEDVEATGLVWSVGDADRICRPVPGTLVRANWMSRPGAQVLMTMFDADGQPCTADPRHALARSAQRLQQLGLRAVVAAEIEFYLVARDAQGKLVPAPGLLSQRSPQRLDSYGLGKLQDMAPLFDDIYAGARAQGLPLRTLMSEYAPGQYEITLLHRDDALRAIDDAILFKRLIRATALKHGLTACFMPKPFADQAGSGMHMHVSVQDASGTNAFAADDPAGAPLLRHAIGGLQKTMAESMLIFAPNANSYRRFRHQSYAPMAPTWGINNRSVSLRVPAGPPSSRHIEHRVSGADANPYLVAATVLAGVHAGITAKLDPGPPITGNGYESGIAASLPRDWLGAIKAADDSLFLHEALGEEFLRAYLAIKTQEWDKYNALVPPTDHDWYLDSV